MRFIQYLFGLFIAFAVVSLAVSAYAQTTEQPLPKALSGNIVGDTASTRFFLDFDQNLSIHTFYMDNPNRIIIDLNEVAFNLEGDSKLEPRGLVSKVQLGRISKGRSRIVLTLVSPVEIIRASMKKRLDENTFRFLLDMDSTDQQTYASLLSEQSLKFGKSGNLAPKGDRVRPIEKKPGRFTIVLDPGHGGIDGGAVGPNNSQEKNIVLAFSKVLREKLESIGPFDVLMTREDDVFLSLRNRLDFSRRSKADLFISIHADSLRQKFVRGSTIYTLSKKASDRLAAQMAESQNAVDLVAGLALEEEVDVVADILVDLTTRETKRFSKRFSGILVDNMKPSIRLIKNPQRSAAFGVLKAPEVPSVLIELGYLSNKEDEKLLQTKAWQEKATQAISNAVIDFFKPRVR